MRGLAFATACCGLLVALQSSAMADGPEGPFGLTFGMSAKRVHHHRIATVSLAGEGSVMGSAETCRWELFGATRVYAPDEWEIDPRSIGRNDDDVRRQMEKNNLHIDYGSSGRLKAGIYSVRIDSRSVPVCLAFFDDQLFFVHLSWDLPTDDGLRDKAELTLQHRYGQPVSEIYSKTWVDRQGKVYIDASAGDIMYVYAPVAREQLREMLSTYGTAAQKKAIRSEF